MNILLLCSSKALLAKWCLCFLICCLGLSQLLFQGASGCIHRPQWFFEPKNTKSVTTPRFSRSICHEVIGPDAMILLFWMLSSKPAFTLSFNFIKRLYNVYFSNWSAWFFKVWMWSIKTPLLLRILTCISIQFLNILQYYILIRMKILHCSPL